MKYSYVSTYNFRPGELYGMGKESLRISGDVPLARVIEILQYNSSIKHQDCKEWIFGTEDFIEREDWKPWLGQPAFYITDIKLDEK